MANLTQFDTTTNADEGSWMQVEHPITRAPIEGCRILLRGEDSPTAKAHARRVIDQRLRARSKSRKPVEITSAELENDAVAHLVVLTAAWEGVAFDDTGEAPCTPENALRAYTEFPFLREQAQEFTEDRANYFRGAGV